VDEAVSREEITVDEAAIEDEAVVVAGVGVEAEDNRIPTVPITRHLARTTTRDEYERISKKDRFRARGFEISHTA
jgi:hypothetical protein